MRGHLLVLFDKRILNRQLLDRLPMVKVLGIEDGATGSQRSSNNEAVVDRKTAIACDFDCRFVQFDGQRLGRIEENLQDAEGVMDFRGTLGVDREAPVGFSAIRLSFELDTDAEEEQLATLLKLTERYCVVYQTLAATPTLSTTLATA